jgi:osmotically-inducible protein OsmY
LDREVDVRKINKYSRDGYLKSQTRPASYGEDSNGHQQSFLDLNHDEKIKHCIFKVLPLQGGGQHINYELNDGCLSLEGFVQDRITKIEITKVLNDLDFVETVQNNLQVMSDEQ